MYADMRWDIELIRSEKAIIKEKKGKHVKVTRFTSKIKRETNVIVLRIE